MKKIYWIAVVGPTGAGKSQFCNYVQKDSTNTKNKVSDSLYSCTQDPAPNVFERLDTKFNFIDTAGNNDSSNNDDENLEKLVNFLKTIKEIDNIFLLLRFGERFSQSSEEYIKKLGKIFTPMEFYNHLIVVFTKSGDPQKLKKKKEKNKDEIIKILKESFSTENTLISKIPDVYFIDTEFDEDTETFDETSQETIDIILKKLLLDDQIYKNKPIDTSNLDISGENAKKREENEKHEIDLLKKKIEEINLQKKAEEQKKKKLEEEIKMNKKNEQERIKKEKELHELLRKQEIEKKRNEEMRKKMEKDRLELQKKEEALYEEARKKKINIDKLDKIMDGCGSAAKVYGIGAVGGILLAIGGAALTIICPVVGPIVTSFGIGMASGGGVGVASSGVVAAGAKIKKELEL